MQKKIGIFLILAILGLSLSAEAQSGAARQSKQNKKNRSTVSSTSSSSETQTGEQNSNQMPNAEITTNDEILHVDTDLVTVPVSVFDREGRFVPGLTKEDFQISENGKPQEIAYFATTETPFTVALVLDMSYSTKFKIDEIQTAAYQFVMGLRPADKVLIVGFDEQVHFLSEPTSDRETLRRAIKQTRIGGGTSLYEAMSLTFERMKKIRGRKAIVLFTDGVDTASRLATEKDNYAQAQEYDALIYPVYYDTYEDVQNSSANPPILNPNPVPGSPVPLPQRIPTIPGTNIPLPQIPQRRRDPQRYPNPNDPRARRDPNDPTRPDPNDPTQRDPNGGVIIGGGSTAAEYLRGKSYLNKLADLTAGRFYEADSYGGLGKAFDQIGEELRRQYSLGYYPAAESKRGEQRAIKVKVNRPKLAVRAREGYVVGEKLANPKLESNNFGKKE